MERIALHLPSDVLHTLKETARRTGQPRAVLMRQALDLYPRRRGRPPLRSLGLGSNADLHGAETEPRIETNWQRT